MRRWKNWRECLQHRQGPESEHKGEARENGGTHIQFAGKVWLFPVVQWECNFVASLRTMFSFFAGSFELFFGFALNCSCSEPEVSSLNCH